MLEVARRVLSGRARVLLCAYASLLAAFLLAGIGFPAQAKDVPARQLNLYGVRTQILNAQRADGLFVYDMDLGVPANDGKPYKKDWDGAILGRNALALLSLSEYLRYIDPKDEAVAKAVRRGLDALVKTGKPIGKSRLQQILEGLGVFDLPFGRYKLWKFLDKMGLLYADQGDGRILTLSDYDNAYIGTTDMALAAEINYEQVTGDRSLEEPARRWLKGILALVTPGGRVRQVPRWLEGHPFADGETWLALGMAVRTIDDPELRKRLGVLEGRMVGVYAQGPQTEFFHWGAPAAAERCEAGVTDMCAFAADYGRRQLNAPPAGDEKIACIQLEGLAGAARAAEHSGDTALAARLTAAARKEMSRSALYQINAADVATLVALGVDPSRAAAQLGGFRESLDGWYLRIDLSAHCLSGMIKAVRAGIVAADALH